MTDTLPPAVSGQGGHNTFMKSACSIIGRCDDDATAESLIRQYNQICQPPFMDAALEHKIKDAFRFTGGTRIKTARVKQDTFPSIKTSLFDGVQASINETISYDDVMAHINDVALKPIVDTLRTTLAQDKSAYDKQKTVLPCITPSGTFNGNHQKNTLAEYNNVVCVDLDDLDSVETLKASLRSDSHVFLMFVSPSGKGLKLFIQIEPYRHDNLDVYHKANLKAVCDYITEKYDVPTDYEKTKDYSRLCFLSYDPEYHYNPHAKAFRKSMLPAPMDFWNLKTKPKTDKQCLLNNWGFERQATIQIVGPTGFGKSVASVQMGTHFACGKPTLGFEPNGVLRVLMFQHEDSENDVATMKQGSIEHMSREEIEIATQNFFIIRLRGLCGRRFIEAVDVGSNQFRPDIIIINPLQKYFGADSIAKTDVNTWLDDLEVLLLKYNCGCILFNHTIKQSKMSRQNQVDTAYAGYGSAAWGDGPRDTIEIQVVNEDEGIFKLRNSKRASKWGWKEKFIRRSGNVEAPYWHLLSDHESLKYQKMSADDKNEALILNVLPTEPVGIPIKDVTEMVGKDERTVRPILNLLIVKKKVVITEEKKPYKYAKKIQQNDTFI